MSQTHYLPRDVTSFVARGQTKNEREKADRMGAYTSYAAVSRAGRGKAAKTGGTAVAKLAAYA